MEKYSVIYEKTVIKDDIPKLGATAALLIKKAIEERLTTEPLKHGKPLQHNFRGWRRLRISKYRIIYRVDEEKHMVKIDAIGIRDKIYDNL